MFDSIEGIIDYLVGVQFHPAVMAVVLIIIALGRMRWEEPYIALARQAVADAAKATPEAAAGFLKTKTEATATADKYLNRILIFAWLVSLLGEFAIYWPKSNQARAICAFMSLAQVGAAWFAYFYIDKWGLMDRIGRVVQKKIDDKGGAA